MQNKYNKKKPYSKPKQHTHNQNRIKESQEIASLLMRPSIGNSTIPKVSALCKPRKHDVKLTVMQIWPCTP